MRRSERARLAAFPSSIKLCPLSRATASRSIPKGWRSYRRRRRNFISNAGKSSALTSKQQIKTLTEIEKTPFFNTVRTHTVIGLLARPEHGGNHDKIGWKLIG